MCGITGFVALKKSSKGDFLNFLNAMNTTLFHRGPDDQGLWVDEKSQIGLAQRRLSIIDLSEAGHQPMHSSCGRWVMVYNGETHSNQELRPILEAKGVRFRGHSDTEVMLEACAALGVEEATKQFIGMFAFAIWDTLEKRLYLVRDRLGVKPLYWSYHQGTLMFGSELKALCAHPEFPRDTDHEAMALYLRYGYIPAPYSIYKHAKKLCPGTILTYRVGEDPKIHTYWSLKTVIEKERHDSVYASPTEEELHALLKDAVQRSMISDVPLGALLSGGIDSSLVVSLMQSQSTRPIKTFTIGFEEEDHNEAPYALAIARHLGTDHTELYITPKEALSVIPRLPALYDEPFADVSQIPTLLVSQLAKQQVTVALSGDGGDEVFAGYNRYLLGEKIWRQCQRLPLRKTLGKALSYVPHPLWRAMEAILPTHYKALRPAERIERVLQMLMAKNSQQLYSSLVSQWADPNALLQGEVEPDLPIFEEASFLKETIEKMQYIDTLSYLPDDVLTKVDRASMAVGLEARVPLLDHRVVAMGWRYSLAEKIHGTKGKWPLREILRDYVPVSLFERPKMGFGVPLNRWLRGPLRDWAEDLLSPSSLSEVMDPDPVQKAWKDHLSGRFNHQNSLWVILMLQAWRKQWRG